MTPKQTLIDHGLFEVNDIHKIVWKALQDSVFSLLGDQLQEGCEYHATSYCKYFKYKRDSNNYQLVINEAFKQILIFC